MSLRSDLLPTSGSAPGTSVAVNRTISHHPGIPAQWPNGSRVMMGPDTEFPERELGRIYREDGQRSRAWSLAADESYRDLGVFDSFLEALGALSTSAKATPSKTQARTVPVQASKPSKPKKKT